MLRDAYFTGFGEQVRNSRPTSNAFHSVLRLWFEMSSLPFHHPATQPPLKPLTAESNHVPQNYYTASQQQPPLIGGIGVECGVEANGQSFSATAVWLLAGALCTVLEMYGDPRGRPRNQPLRIGGPAVL